MTVANVNVTKVLLKRGNTAQNNNYTGVNGELTIDTQLKTLRVHDGVTAGGDAITASGVIGAYSNTNTAAYLASQSITSGNIGAFQTYANSNAATQATSIDSINANVGAFQTFANANAATQTTEINSLRANITAANSAITSLQSNAAVQAALLDTLTGNAATQSQVLDTLTSNAATQATTLTTLLSNAVAQQTSLIDLVANAATQAQAIANVTGTYSNANVATYLSSFDGNILPSSNVTYSLGDATHQWRDLWVSNNTIYIGNTPIRVDGGTLLINGAPISGTANTGDITFSGRIISASSGTGSSFITLNDDIRIAGNDLNLSPSSGDSRIYFYPDNNVAAGSQLTIQTNSTNDPDTNQAQIWARATGNYAQRRNLLIGTDAGDVQLRSTGDNASTKTWTFDRFGNLVLPNLGNINYANGTSILSGLNTSSYGNANVATYLPTYTGNIAGNIVKNGYTWTFGTGGNLTVPAGGTITAPIAQEFQLQSRDTNSVLRNEINLDPNNGTYMSVWSDGTTSFSFNDWDTGSWNNESGLGAARFTNAEDLQDFWTTGIGSLGLPIEASINGGARTPNVFYDGNNGETYGVTLGLDAVPPGGQGTTVPITSLVFYYQTQSKINIDRDGGEILLDAQSMDLDLRTTNILDLRAGENLNLRGLGAYPVRIYTDDTTHKWEFDTTGSLTLPREGKIYGVGDGVAAGDRLGYISWAGNTSGDGSGLNTMRLVPDQQGLEELDQYIILDPTFNEPGIHIRAGGTQGNSQANLYLGGANSHVKIGAGSNPPVNVMANNRSWIFGNTGTTQFPDGTILAPVSQSITMQSDQYAQLMWQNANQTVAPDMAVMSNFYVAQNNATLDIVYRDGSSNQQQKSWLWNIDGMTLPEGGTITEGGGLTGAIRLTPAGGANADQALLIYPTAGGDGDHIHLTAGGGTTELYLGSDNHYVKLVNGGNVEIRTDDMSGNTAQWMFGVDRSLSMPTGGNLIFDSSATSVIDGISSITFADATTQTTAWTGSVTFGNTIAIGYNSATVSQGGGAVAVGSTAGNVSQGIGAVAVGEAAGTSSQGTEGIAIGKTAGEQSQGAYSIAIGSAAAYYQQRTGAIAIGTSAGALQQGTHAIAIGTGAGSALQGNNSIILNATGSALEQTTADTFTVAPVRNDVSNVAQVLFYNTTSKEITYGNTISIAGNINANQYNFANGVNILSTVGAGAYGNTQVASYLLNFDGDIEFTSSTAKIGNVDVITVMDSIRSPAYQFSNGTSILAGITGTYSNTNVAAYLTTGITTANLTTTGNVVQQSAYYETYANITNSGGNLTCNFVNGATFYATLTTNVTVNFANAVATAGQVTGATIIVDQGATAYSVANIQINGGGVQTVKWAGGTTNTGTASNTDVMSFSLISLDGTSWRILGQIANYA
jgi:hypothetical protein